jgi:CTD small phosphatase-like protein 2
MEFLTELSRLYEIVIFTAGMEEYADWVLNQLDEDKKLIDYRLYRQHTINFNKEGPLIIKDLSKLGRPLERTIIVDNLAENFILQKDNGIFIQTWLEDPADTQLRDMIPLLKQIVIKEVADVRVTLRSFRDQMARLISSGQGNALPPIE